MMQTTGFPPKPPISPRRRMPMAWRTGLALAIPSLLLALATGCQPKTPSRNTQAARGGKNTGTQAAQDTQADLPGRITGAGFHIPITKRDPKNPNGPPIRVLTADAQTGSAVNQNDSLTFYLNNVHARIFRNGKPAADLSAPRMTYDRRTKTVIATGGIQLTSLPAPAQTVVTADKMTWDTDTSQIVAEGHAFATTRQNGNSIQQSGGRILLDMARKPYEIRVE